MGRRVAVVLGPQAVADLRSARDYYADLDPGLVPRLHGELERVMERLELFPASGTPVEGMPGVRRARMRHFPYGVFYRLVGADEIRIVRVLHTRRDMGSAGVLQ